MRALLQLHGLRRLPLPHRRPMTSRLLALSIVSCGVAVLSAQAPAPSAEITVVHVQKNVYLLASSTGNVAAQIGEDGVLLVDTGTAPMAQKLFAAVHTLSDKPIHTIINTHLHADHTGGNQALVKLGAGGPQP